MSVEQAKALIEKLQYDENFRLSILAIEDVNARLRAIIDAGYTCSIEEIQQANSEIGPRDDISGGSWLEDIFPSTIWET
ncbi:MAG: Nif11-like leader peptide family natural product precursor [Chlorobium sp.]|nr:MAG: Nif11-like leader peptide family natural product precursor [Chlorobium sp.]